MTPEELIISVARENMSPDPVQRLHARVERLEAELRRERESSAAHRLHTREAIDALSRMVDILAQRAGVLK